MSYHADTDRELRALECDGCGAIGCTGACGCCREPNAYPDGIWTGPEDAAFFDFDDLAGPIPGSWTDELRFPDCTPGTLADHLAVELTMTRRIAPIVAEMLARDLGGV